jgi:hypothetical protein
LTTGLRLHDSTTAVIAGLDPAIPIMWHGGAFISGMAGSSPAMTVPENMSCSNLARQFHGKYRPPIYHSNENGVRV